MKHVLIFIWISLQLLSTTVFAQFSNKTEANTLKLGSSPIVKTTFGQQSRAWFPSLPFSKPTLGIDLARFRYNSLTDNQLLSTSSLPKAVSSYDNWFFGDAALTINAGFEYNYWLPYMSDYLEYTTEGFRVFSGNVVLNHGLKWFPCLQFSWRSNLGMEHQKEILAVQKSKSKLEQGYNKLKGIMKFSEYDIDRDIYHFTMAYTKETFFIGATPTLDYLSYVGFNNSTPVGISRGTLLSNYTKFEEIDFLFFTDGFGLIPGLVSALSSGSNAQVMTMEGVDTRLGLFFSTFHKPYMSSQVMSAGQISGNYNEIYDARFNTYGIIEQYNSNPTRNFVCSYSPRFGLSFVKLNSDLTLSDTESPLFFYYGHEFELGFKINMSHADLKLTVNCDASFMLGGDMFKNETTQNSQMETKSFINSDVLFKVKASFSFHSKPYD